MTIESNTLLISNWLSEHPYLGALLLIWSLSWKAVALWKAAERQQKYWFGAILLLNSLGILEIIYIYFVAKRYKVEVVNS